MPKVYNKRHTYPPNAVYVGRPTQWGNPFKIGEDGTREEVIEKFEGFCLQILKKKPDWLDLLKGKDLVCWCAPEACHADVLLRLANAEPENFRSFVIRSNQVNRDSFRITLCEGDLLEDGRIRITWRGNRIINARTGKRDRVQLQNEYDTLDALLKVLEDQNIRHILWRDAGEYEYINKE